MLLKPSWFRNMGTSGETLFIAYSMYSAGSMVKGLNTILIIGALYWPQDTEAFTSYKEKTI